MTSHLLSKFFGRIKGQRISWSWMSQSDEDDDVRQGHEKKEDEEEKEGGE